MGCDKRFLIPTQDILVCYKWCFFASGFGTGGFAGLEVFYPIAKSSGGAEACARNFRRFLASEFDIDFQDIRNVVFF